MICTIEPLLSSYHSWFTYGAVPPFTGEIHLCNDPRYDADHHDFWDHGIVLKEPNMDETLQIPALIRPLADTIRKAGKAVEMIKYLGKLSPPSNHLYKSFINEYFGKDLRVYPDTTRIKTEPNYESLRHFDPLLVSSFHDIMSTFQDHHRRMDNDIFNEVWDNIENCHIIPSLKVEHLVRGLLEERCNEVRLSLLKVLNTHYDLTEHMATLRKVFLMEAGLDLSQFTNEVYTSLSKDNIAKDWTIVFRESVGPCTKFAKLFKAECDPDVDRSPDKRFRNFIEIQTFVVSYNCDFPVDVLIDSSTLESYQHIFKLLLEINYAAWSIFPLSLNSFKNVCPVDVSTEVYSFLFELTNVIKIIKAYVMDYVLNTTCRQMEEELTHVQDVDEFMTVHRRYLQIMESRCLLTSNYENMLFLIRIVLDAAVFFRKEWETGDFKGKGYNKLVSDVKRSLKLIKLSLSSYTAQTTAPKPHLEWLGLAFGSWH